MRAKHADTGETLRFPIPAQPQRAHTRPHIEMILAASAEMLPVWNGAPDSEKRRLARKCHTRFVLQQRAPNEKLP